ncbi:unnamed protein product, partial [marine sediment metagenome]
DAEQITYSVLTDTGGTLTTVNVTARGANSTTEVSHGDGSDVFEVLGQDTPVTWAGDMRAYGLFWEEVASRMGYEGRFNLWPEETATEQVWKMLAADVDYKFPAPTQTLTHWAPNGVAELARDITRDLFSRYAYLYGVDVTQGNGSDIYLSIAQAGPDSHHFTVPTQGQMQTVETTYGRLDAPVVNLQLLQDFASGVDPVFGYFLSERIRNARSFGLSGVPWFEGYDLEAGDVVTFQPGWSSTPISARVIEYVKGEDEQIGLTLIEVDTV